MTNPKVSPEMVKLKPCPFCGEQPQSYWVGDTSLAGDDGYWAIEHCHVGVHLDTEEEATAAWNTRALSAQPSEPVGWMYECLLGYLDTGPDWQVEFSREHPDPEHDGEGVRNIRPVYTAPQPSSEVIETDTRLFDALRIVRRMKESLAVHTVDHRFADAFADADLVEQAIQDAIATTPSTPPEPQSDLVEELIEVAQALCEVIEVDCGCTPLEGSMSPGEHNLGKAKRILAALRGQA
ncbi:hypothetical protein INR77_09080 [Erythrobacter sp. SCSIO 43205]|uniref:hypothetical protein n=1 Tax=Erythrobacter sp. SCSIO 43205 TaxID=2779361 RepID=UPI001CA9548B|nr:hypothetical protein [Erythrobacter sp. SCSIO 43205]UAB76999.1 hypothetical protein INR77_09080 [Erythrobacter sp. SCSIO 43205]